MQADNFTPLMRASRDGDYETVRTLLESSNRGINDQTSRSKYTALMLAAKYGHTDIVSLLIANRADVDLTDRNGQTAIMIAAKNGHVGVITILLYNHARTDCTDNAGYSMLDLALKGNHVDAARTILWHDFHKKLYHMKPDLTQSQIRHIQQRCQAKLMDPRNDPTVKKRFNEFIVLIRRRMFESDDPAQETSMIVKNRMPDYFIDDEMSNIMKKSIDIITYADELWDNITKIKRMPTKIDPAFIDYLDNIYEIYINVEKLEHDYEELCAKYPAITSAVFTIRIYTMKTYLQPFIDSDMMKFIQPLYEILFQIHKDQKKRSSNAQQQLQNAQTLRQHIKDGLRTISHKKRNCRHAILLGKDDVYVPMQNWLQDKRRLLTQKYQEMNQRISALMARDYQQETMRD